MVFERTFFENLQTLKYKRFKSISPIFIVAGEAVDDDWNWKSHDEDSTKSAKASNQLAQERVRIQVVPHGGDRHQAPPRFDINRFE
jgi:hypothetical protein